MMANAFRGGTKGEQDVPDLQAQTENYAWMVEHERIRVERLEEELTAVKDRIESGLQLRRKRGGHNAPRQAINKIHKQIRLAEESLHRRLLKLGDVSTAGSNLKLVINQLRQEQVQLKEVYQTLRDELAQMQKRMDRALQQAADVCEQRDKAFDDLTTVHETVESEERQHRVDMTEWNKIVREEKQRQEILRVQQGKHADDNSSLRALIELQNTKKIEAEDVLRRAELTRTQQLSQEREAQDMMEKYLVAFEKLHELTGIHDVDRLVEMFVAVEDENFATFNFIQHLNREIEREEEIYMKIWEEQNKYLAAMGNTDKSRSHVIRSLESRLAKTLSQHKAFEEGAADYKVQLQMLSVVVDSIFHKAECDQMSGLRNTWSRPEEKKISASDTALTTDIAILHTDAHPMVMPDTSLHTLMQHGVTSMTIVPYLGLIEQRAAEIINAFLAFRGAQATGQGLPTIPPKSATPVVPPTLSRARSPMATQQVMPVRILTMPGDQDDDEIGDGEETPIPRTRMREFAVMTYRREMEAAASRKVHKKDSTHGLSKSMSRMPRINGVRGRRQSSNALEGGSIAKKRAQARANTAGMINSRSTPAMGGAWG